MNNSKISEEISFSFINKEYEKIFLLLNKFEVSVKKSKKNRFELNEFYVYSVNVLLALSDLTSTDKEMRKKIVFTILSIVSTKLQLTKDTCFIFDKVIRMLLNNKYLLEYNKLYEFKEDLFPSAACLDIDEARAFLRRKDKAPKKHTINLEILNGYINELESNRDHAFALRYLSSFDNPFNYRRDVYLSVLKKRRILIFKTYYDSFTSLSNPLPYLDKLKESYKDFYVILAEEDPEVVEFGHSLVDLAMDFLDFNRDVDASECIEMAKVIFKLKNIKNISRFKRALGEVQYGLEDYKKSLKSFIESVNSGLLYVETNAEFIFDTYIRILDVLYLLKESDKKILDYTEKTMESYKKTSIEYDNHCIFYHAFITFIKIGHLREAKKLIYDYIEYEDNLLYPESSFIPLIHNY